MAHNWYDHCAKCGAFYLKREMRPLFTAETRYHPPRILCHLCQACYCKLLDELEIVEK